MVKVGDFFERGASFEEAGAGCALAGFISLVRVLHGKGVLTSDDVDGLLAHTLSGSKDAATWADEPERYIRSGFPATPGGA